MLAFWLIFITLMLPLEVRIVPTYEVAGNALLPLQQLLDVLWLTDLVAWLSGVEVALEWNLLDTYWGLTLPLFASATATFLFRQFFLTIPEELAEAAKMDGAGPLRFFFQILLPLSKPSLMALGIFVFMGTWNEFFQALLLINEDSKRTLPLGLTAFQDEYFTDFALSFAGINITAVPVIIVYIMFQRNLIEGITVGSLK